MLPDTFRDSGVCIIGLGYVGLTLAVAMADVGYRVYGVEKDAAILGCLNTGRAHFSEVGLDEKLSRQLALGNISFSNEIIEKCPATVFVVTVGTPVGTDKRTKFDALQVVLEALSKNIKNGDLVVLRSTVRVGTCREIVMPILDATKRNYELAFCPERTLEGKAVEELRSLPQIVGGKNSASTFRASQVFSMLTPMVVRVNDLETAEMIKLVNNTQRDLTFAFANEVATLCDALGVSAKEVIQSGNLGYPRAGLPLPGPVGGPCLEKDPYILAEGFESFGVTPELALKGRKCNESLPERTLRDLFKEYERIAGSAPKRVAILGLAFKGRPETNDLRGSVAISVIEQVRILDQNVELVGWDPIVASRDIENLGVISLETLEKAFDGTDIVIIQNNHLTFEKMDIFALSSRMSSPAIVYDYWCQRDPRTVLMAEGVSYRGLGAFNVDLRNK